MILILTEEREEQIDGGRPREENDIRVLELLVENCGEGLNLRERHLVHTESSAATLQVQLVSQDAVQRVGAQVRAQTHIVAASLENVERVTTLTVIVWELRILLVEEELKFLRRQLENRFVCRNVLLLPILSQRGRLISWRHVVSQLQ